MACLFSPLPLLSISTVISINSIIINPMEDQAMKLQRGAFRWQTLCLLVLSAVALGFAPSSSAQESYNVKEHYTKFEYQIAMRDGVKLFTSVYAPKDTSQKYPMIMQRTPYSVAPYGPDAYKTQLGPSPLFMKEGFIFVYQDVRGRTMSEGDFAWMRPYK